MLLQLLGVIVYFSRMSCVISVGSWWGRFGAVVEAFLHVFCCRVFSRSAGWCALQLDQDLHCGCLRYCSLCGFFHTMCTTILPVIVSSTTDVKKTNGTKQLWWKGLPFHHSCPVSSYFKSLDPGSPAWCWWSPSLVFPKGKCRCW